MAGARVGDIGWEDCVGGIDGLWQKTTNPLSSMC